MSVLLNLLQGLNNSVFGLLVSSDCMIISVLITIIFAVPFYRHIILGIGDSSYFISSIIIRAHQPLINSDSR